MTDFLTEIRQTHLSRASRHDLEQAITEYGRGLDYYRARIQAIDFGGFPRVLDAACGWGQWSMVLSEVNKTVVAVDLNLGGLEISAKAAKYYGRNNIVFSAGDLHMLPYRDNAFEAVFCYGVLMYTREDVVLSELSRVLKPGGRLYICSNGPGWPLYKVLKIGLPRLDAHAMLGGIKILTNKIFHDMIPGKFSGKLTYLRKGDIIRLLTANKLEILHYGAESSYGNRDVPALYGSFFGLPADFEVIGKKR
jgi:ubiquinone/menaquinone biosynthesis C-methylase UbiE